MTTATQREESTATAGPKHTACTWDKAVACFTRPEWSVQHTRGGLLGAGSSSLDAALHEGPLRPGDLDAAARALVPLGRLVAAGSWEEAHALEATLGERADLGLAVTSRLILDDGRRVTVAERCADVGLEPRRGGAHPGAYKMSRYKAYHQMQSAVARLVPIGVRDIIEIGDSNGVIRAMLGGGIGGGVREPSYFRAHYPPHDLQTLDLIPAASCDVFICDNTLEHVADPHAAVRQMSRVIRPGGWLVLFAPFIAMCQDDDRCRWSKRALAELLAPHFDAGMLGAWGNVEACCWYMRANKWLRVLGERGGVLTCRDSRDPASPVVEVPAHNDRLHPIHVWAVARRAGGERATALDATPLSRWAGLDVAHKEGTAALAAALPRGARVGVISSTPASVADRLSELAARPVCVCADLWGATDALSNGFESHASLAGAGQLDAVVLDPEGTSPALPASAGELVTGLPGASLVLGDGERARALASELAARGLRERRPGLFTR